MRLTRSSNRILSLVLGLALGLPLVGVSAPSSSGTTDDIPRWQPRYKPGAQAKLSQRERRTGDVEDRSEYEEVTPEAQPKASKPRLLKRGLFPFKKKSAVEKKETKGIWPFGKKKDNGDKATEGTTDIASTVTAGEVEGAAKGAEEKAERKSKKAEEAAKKTKAPKLPSLPDLVKKAQRKDANLPGGTPEAYARGKDAFERGNYTKAIQSFSDFIGSADAVDSPLLAPARYFIAKSFHGLEQNDVAVSLYQQVRQEHAQSRFWSGLAKIELASLGETPVELEPEGTEEIAPIDVPVEDKGTAEPVPTPDVGGPPADAPNEAPTDAPGRLPGN